MGISQDGFVKCSKYYSEEQVQKMLENGHRVMSYTPHYYQLDDDFDEGFNKQMSSVKPLEILDQNGKYKKLFLSEELLVTNSRMDIKDCIVDIYHLLNGRTKIDASIRKDIQSLKRRLEKSVGEDKEVD